MTDERPQRSPIFRAVLPVVICALSVVIFAAGCAVEESDADGDRCPPEMQYDEDLNRCIDAESGLDAGGEDTGSEDAGDENGTTEDSGDQTDAGDGDDTGGNENDTTGDAGDQTDAGGGDDAGDDSPCDAVTCGDNATCQQGDCVCDDGYDGDPYEECFAPPPCDGGCSDGASCIDDQCICDPGFYSTAEGCELEEVGDPAERTEAEVCQRWNEDLGENTFDKWAEEPENQCDWGWLREEYHREALAETTRHRWLVGLPAVTTSESARESTQACATALAAEDTLTHDVTEDFECYSDEAASGAGSSNIAAGAVSAASTVQRYIRDWSTPSLGHRRWVFNPGMGRTAFGIRDGYSCMYSFDNSGSADPEFTAYPAPGYFPTEAFEGKWSFASGNVSINSETDVTVENLADDSTLSINDFKYHSGGWYRPPMISWEVDTAPQPGDQHRVTIADAYAEGDDLVYEFTLVNCE